MLEFNTALEKDVLVIELEGSLDSHSAVDFRQWFNEKTAAGYRAFAVDCLCLEYISSAGIAAIIDLQTYLANQGGKMVLYQLSGETRQLLRFLQLDTKLNLVGDYDDAITALTGYKRIVREAEPEIVAPEELHVLGETTAEKTAASAHKNSDAAPLIPTENQPEATVAPQPAASGNEMLVEEHFAAEKKGLHPVHTETAAAQKPTQTPAPVAVEEKPEPVAVQTAPLPSPEVQELRINTGAKRLISCPNCKSVLRVQAAGDYLCPACRFRFAYKASA